jgi:flagellar hook-length control protein FliK
MSIQPLSIASAPADAGPRRRAAEREQSERESFVLPQDEPVREAPAASRERREASAEAEAPVRDGREPSRATEERKAQSDEAKSAKAEESGQADASGEATADKPAKAGQTEPQKPAAAPAAAPKPASAAKPDLDVAALVTIAQAAQGETPAQAPSTLPGTAVAAGAIPAPQAGKTEATAETDEAAKSAEEPKGEGAILVALPDVVTTEPVPTVPAQFLTVPAPAATPGPTASAPPQEGDVLAGKGGTAAAAQAAAAIAARMPATPGANLQPVAGQASGPEVAGVPASQPGTDAFAAAVTLAAEAAQAQAPKAEALPTGLPANAEGVAKPDAAVASTAVATAEFKPLERLDQALSAIDLSSLTAQGSARPDPLRLLSTPDPILAQTAAQPGHASNESPPTPLHVLPIEIGLKALSGARQFDIRLDPGELGRVDVTLSISDTGEVSAKMVVDRVETLHLLQRDARTLERAFEQAGLKPSDSGVDISLRDPSDQSGFRQQRQQDDTPQRSRGPSAGAETGDDIAVTPLSAPQRRFVRLGGVDMSV